MINNVDENLEIILNQNIELFHDEKQNPWIRIDDEGVLKIYPCDGIKTALWCRSVLYQTLEKNPGRESIKSIIELLKAKALFDGPEHQLHNRVAWYKEKILYDLTNSTWSTISISKDGWEVTKINHEPILFKRYTHHKSQVDPQLGGDVRRILDFLNITDEDQKILFLVWIISCFIPGIPHPLAYVYGPQGSAKSSVSRITRELVDPSQLGIVTFPENNNELIQQLEHNWFSFFDNVSYVDQKLSDCLCKAITGIGVSKRELYTNDGDVIYNFKRCIGINGINLDGTQPDLLERSILFPLKRMDDSQRISEEKLFKGFQEEKALILGAIFTAVSNSMKIKDQIVLGSSPRMADFAIWGCAIAKSIGYSQEQFLNAYNRNIESQTDEAINNSDIAVTIRDFMSDKKTWEGTPRELYQVLSESLWNERSISRLELPKNEVILSKKINQLEVPLGKIGITIERERSTHRTIRLINHKYSTTVTNDESDSESFYDDPGQIPF
ncbi:MAG: hypothetical protein WCG20_01540 [bacterium]